MKKAHKALALAALCLLSSCGLFQNYRIEQDEVRATSRIRADFEYRTAREWVSPLINVVQTVVRETGADAEPGLRFFDRVLLNPRSYRLDNRVYLILDGKPYQVRVEHIEFERLSNIQEKRKDVITADSSKVSVVTGYDRNDSNSYKIMYTVGPEVVERIKASSKMRFRYYAGPDMITTTMSSFELKTLKKILEISYN